MVKNALFLSLLSLSLHAMEKPNQKIVPSSSTENLFADIPGVGQKELREIVQEYECGKNALKVALILTKSSARISQQACDSASFFP